MDADVVVVGAGIVGAALAFGAAKLGKKVIVLDGEDGDLRAARANFGLVWVQGKGASNPAYSILSLESSDAWPSFISELVELVEMRVDYQRSGGLNICLGEDEFNNRAALLQRMHNQQTGAGTEMIERNQLETLIPAVKFGPEVVGASFCRFDGVVNPLQLLAALQKGIRRLDGQILFRCPVTAIVPLDDGFSVKTDARSYRSKTVIVAAGLAIPSLTEPLGLKIPLRSERGQLLVTERIEEILPLPASGLRQTADGTVMIGATKEAETDRGVTVASATKLASKATRIIPALADVRLVRQWSGFRVMPLDGAPIYAESKQYPGLFAAACHSGVTLAATHASRLVSAMVEGRLSQDFAAFSNGRFDVQKCA